MKLKISYFDNCINIDNENINAIEIENKTYFYRFVNDLHNLSTSNQTDSITFIDEGKEIKYNDKIKLYINFFDFEFDSKKTTNDISKYALNIITEEEKSQLQKEYAKIIKTYKRIINNIDLPLSIDDEVNLDSLAKTLKLSINKKEELLDNLFLLIDIENTFKTKNILIFINLKQYLSKEEISELYKYSIYNQVKIILIDSQAYGTTLENEKKLIIDENLDEFML